MLFVKQALFLFIAAVCFAGCSSKPEEAPAETKPEATTAAAIADFTNAEGKLLCLVMNQTMDKKEDAVSYQDYEGKRYYFCCKMCPKKFADNPAQFAKK